MKRLRELEGVSWPGITDAMQMCLDCIYIEHPLWGLLRALGVDPRRDAIDEFGSWMARNVATSHRPDGLL